MNMQEGIDLAKAPLTAWFDQQLRPEPSTAGPGLSMPFSSGGNNVKGRVVVPSGVSNSSGSSRGSPKFVRGRRRRERSSSSSSNGGGGGSSSGSRFKDWVCREEAVGKIRFVVKGLGDVCGPAAATPAV
jgi:hypothetical protein